MVAGLWRTLRFERHGSGRALGFERHGCGFQSFTGFLARSHDQ